jgi:hypothetical protein
MTNIEFSIDSGQTRHLWHRCRAGRADATLARLQALYADACCLWRKIEVAPQEES